MSKDIYDPETEYIFELKFIFGKLYDREIITKDEYMRALSILADERK